MLYLFNKYDGLRGSVGSFFDTKWELLVAMASTELVATQNAELDFYGGLIGYDSGDGSVYSKLCSMVTVAAVWQAIYAALTVVFIWMLFFTAPSPSVLDDLPYQVLVDSLCLAVKFISGYLCLNRTLLVAIFRERMRRLQSNVNGSCIVGA